LRNSAQRAIAKQPPEECTILQHQITTRYHILHYASTFREEAEKRKGRWTDVPPVAIVEEKHHEEDIRNGVDNLREMIEHLNKELLKIKETASKNDEELLKVKKRVSKNAEELLKVKEKVSKNDEELLKVKETASKNDEELKERVSKLDPPPHRLQSLSYSTVQ
jgi:chromosome segregation ATPase